LARWHIANEDWKNKYNDSLMHLNTKRARKEEPNSRFIITKQNVELQQNLLYLLSGTWLLGEVH
jgi:hypothetical protein